LNSQQTIIELTNELEESHGMLALKESDCTRLARELGASQVREAQEKARLSQELRMTIKNHDHKNTQKAEEVYEPLLLFQMLLKISQIRGCETQGGRKPGQHFDNIWVATPIFSPTNKQPTCLNFHSFERHSIMTFEF